MAETSNFNLSALLVELESGGCEDLTVQELEFVLEYINKGLRNKVVDWKQEPVAWMWPAPAGFQVGECFTPAFVAAISAFPLYTHPSNVCRLKDGDIVRINNKKGSIFSKAYAIMDACNIPKEGE